LVGYSPHIQRAVCLCAQTKGKEKKEVRKDKKIRKPGSGNGKK
jgi:hypothetical protein